MTKISLESIDPILSDLKHSLTALTNKNYPKVIELSTRGFDRLMRNHALAFLYSRSVACESQGLLTQALEDAERMIQYVPDTASGYLRAGLVYMAHGKPKEALKIYNQGIKEADPDRHKNEYNQLHTEKEIAIQRSNQCVDIVAHLPQELLGKILNHLDSRRIWVCLKVSKIWCDKVSRYGTVWWNSVVVKQTEDDEMDQAICDALPLVKNYVHDLKLFDTWSMTLNLKYLDYLKNGVFENIKSLTLKGTSIFENMSSEELCIGLWQMRRTLTALTIDYGDGSTVSSLLAVLSVCPGIDFLHYTCHDSLTFEGHKKILGSRVLCKRLTTLRLYYDSSTIYDIYKYLALCPNIHSLTLQSSSCVSFGHDSNKSITDICPKLKVLNLNAFFEDGIPFDSSNTLKDEKKDDLVTTTTTITEENKEERPGIQYIQVRFDEHFRFDDVAGIIENQAHSLRELSISFAQPDDPHRITFPLRIIKRYPLLTKFQFVCEDNIPYVPIFHPAMNGNNRLFPATSATSVKSSVEHLVANIINHSVLLRDIVLKNMKAPTNSALFDNRNGSSVSMLNNPNVLSALNIAARRRQLKILTLSSVYFSNTIPNNNQQQGGGIGAFFTEACQSLQKLTIQQCNLLTDNTLLTLARATSTIEQLDIIGCQEITKDGLRNFLKELAKVEQQHNEQQQQQVSSYPLKEIGFDALSNLSITDEVLHYVTDIKSLQKIRITKCSSITVNGIKELIKKAATLNFINNIEIRHCHSVLFLAVSNPNWKQEFEKVNSNKIKLSILV
ncbi:hypothetical protein BDC45DRAFT_529778 [Circinella umbellata]|nr:hypothetical protein BDC45DRAFT_529778 [Circinella umbellata]